MSKWPVDSKCVNIIGSSLNICLGNGPENDSFDFEDEDKFIKIIEMMVKMYTNNENKDYLGTTLIISVNLSKDNHYRKAFRSKFLTVNNLDFIKQWKILLLSSDTSISFLTGEFLYSLCEGNANRLIRHVGFETLAGYFYSKGILKGRDLESNIVIEGDSSDEEYFKDHPIEEMEHTPLIPESEEEALELEYLMQKITEYNSKSQRNQQ